MVCGRRADGFNFMPAYQPGDLEDFVEGVIPIRFATTTICLNSL
jgi:hypothetical protein